MDRVEWLAVLVCSVVASLAAIVWSWQNDALLNWGDAVAHMHIARRVFDSHQPRLSQLGSVWLPLPHILMLPFVHVYSWWANGIAGIVPSALAYVRVVARLRDRGHSLERIKQASDDGQLAIGPIDLSSGRRSWG